MAICVLIPLHADYSTLKYKASVQNVLIVKQLILIITTSFSCHPFRKIWPLVPLTLFFVYLIEMAMFHHLLWPHREVWIITYFINPLPPNVIYICRAAPLTSRHYILNISSTNIRTEYFKHAAYSWFFSLQNAVYFIMQPCLVPELFTF
jgi:hypothetical protein